MKYLVLVTLTSLALLTGCAEQMASVGLSSADKAEECQTIDKKLVKVDHFIETVNSNSAFHMEEVAQIGYAPNITASNNKPRMLKDADNKKEALLKERQKLGCEAVQN